MSISLLLEMVVSDHPDRTVLVDGDTHLTADQLNGLVDAAAGLIAASGCRHVAYVGTGGATLPLLLFAAARAGLPVSPLNYRLSATSLLELLDRLDSPFVVADAEYIHLFGDAVAVMDSDELLVSAANVQVAFEFPDPEDVAVVLFTSGTTARPKAVELTHNNLTSYITGTVEFASAATDDTALICVPPYHIAGVGAALSNLYAGRRLVYLRQFDAQAWLRLVNAEAVTTAGVVPTMLERI
ncbi:AMP-binding protein, partial [Mycobacterium avium]